jgi:hypothetical protein
MVYTLDIGCLRLAGYNAREHHMARHRRVKMERGCVATALMLRWRGFMPGDPSEFRAAMGPALPKITITRCSPGPGLDDHDNLRGACKAIVDELARWLGVDDKVLSSRLTYAQLRAPWGVRVDLEVESAAATPPRPPQGPVWPPITRAPVTADPERRPTTADQRAALDAARSRR